MCCLTCTFYAPTEPEQHRIEREAGKCEGSCGDKWNWYTAFRYVKQHTDLTGVCRLNPQGISKVSWDVCGQHRPVLSPDNGWGVHAFGDNNDDRGLIEWAAKQYLNIKEGGYAHWSIQKNAELTEQNRLLREQLAIARKRSASRLAKLKKAAKAKPAVKPEQSQPEALAPMSLRLVG